MINRLTVKNFAIIKDLDITFSDGFNVLTGETGAGKSILTSSLNLLMGIRATVDLIRHGEEKCEVMGYFSNISGSMKNSLEELDIDFDQELIIRRVIRRNKASRVYINSVPVSISFLQSFMHEYFSILSQHQSQSLFNTKVQLELLDSFLGLNKLRNTLESKYKELKVQEKITTELISEESQVVKKLDYLDFQIKEITDLNLIKDEDTVLEKNINKSKHALKIINCLKGIDLFLNSSSSSVSSTLLDRVLELENYSNLDKDIQSLSEKINSIIEICDGTSSLINNLYNEFNTDESDLESQKTRLYEINRLKKKFTSVDLDSLLSELEKMKKEQSELKNFDNNLEINKNKLQVLKEEYYKIANELTLKRKEGIDKFSKEIENNLKFLSMEKAKFSISLNTSDTPSKMGLDTIEYHIAPNPGEEQKSIAKIASGGELSRIMLSIQSSTSRVYKFAIQVYDEIDTGIGGDVAFKVGKLLKEISNGSQCIVVTHLPQIAVFANNHISIQKYSSTNETYVKTKKLNESTKVDELSSMLGMKDEENVHIHIKDMINKAKNYLQT